MLVHLPGGWAPPPTGSPGSAPAVSHEMEKKQFTFWYFRGPFFTYMVFDVFEFMCTCDVVWPPEQSRYIRDNFP